MGQPVEQVRVVLSRDLFVDAVVEAAPLGTSRLIHIGTAPGFRATLTELALFFLAARDRFGPADTTMLALIMIRQGGDEYYFPGLELY